MLASGRDVSTRNTPIDPGSVSTPTPPVSEAPAPTTKPPEPTLPPSSPPQVTVTAQPPNVAEPPSQATRSQPSATAASGVRDVKLREASIQFNKPTQAYVDRPIQLDLRVGLSPDADAQLGTSGEVITRSVKITRQVRAQLIGSDFDIKPLGDGEAPKTITESTYGLWSWQVTPKTGGPSKKLRLVIEGAASEEGKQPQYGVLRDYSETIEVTVHPDDRLPRVFATLKEYWQIIAGVGSALVVLVGWLVAFARSRKRKSADS